MSVFERGFFIERITVTGRGLADADLQFRDGLNVVEGASDTGKSYIAELMDFALGASRPPRRIQAADGYERVRLILRERRTQRRHQIERNLDGGDAIVCVLGTDGTVETSQLLAAKHSADDDQNLSHFLLSLSGFVPTKVRKNKKGDTQSLSFRNIAHLAIIDETRIMSESPPHLSGSPVSATPEGEVLRIVLTGRTATAPIVAPRKATSQAAKAQAELLRQLEDEVRGEISALGLQPELVKEESQRVEEIRVDLVKEYESYRVEIVAREHDRGELGRALRLTESRLSVIEGLIARFELLDRHYEMDLARLEAIEETGSMLGEMPASSCPVCGAAPDAHRPADAAEHFGLDRVRLAANMEGEKIARLRKDLQNVFMELRAEQKERLESGERIRGELDALQARISSDLAPRARTSAEKLTGQDRRRDALVHARSLVDRLEDLERRRTSAETAARRGKAAPLAEPSKVTTSEMDSFAQVVQRVLAEWNYPDSGRVVFSDDAQDLVIGSQDRASHGKGVRALTCAAFISGILRHCALNELPHPGLVVLDSPLVAYKDPDSQGTDGARFRQAGVKDAFYRALAGDQYPGQTIVLENEVPPADLAGVMVYHHFSKSETGRYGFFPRAGKSG